MGKRYASLYTYVYKFLFSKITTKSQEKIASSFNFTHSPLKICKYFSSLHKNPAKKKKAKEHEDKEEYGNPFSGLKGMR